MCKIRVIVVDDSAVFRKAAVAFLGTLERVEVVAQAADGLTGLARIQELKPDLALIDVVMPGMTGFELVRGIRQGAQPPRILVVTLYEDQPVRHAAGLAGADGFVAKSRFVHELPGCIDALFGVGQCAA